LNDEEFKEFQEDCIKLCREIGKFINKWKGKMFLPLEKALRLLELWLGGEENVGKSARND